MHKKPPQWDMVLPFAKMSHVYAGTPLSIDAKKKIS
jgi:hypothetical protein